MVVQQHSFSMEVKSEEKLTYQLFLESHDQFLYAEALLCAFNEHLSKCCQPSCKCSFYENFVRSNYGIMLQTIRVGDILNKWQYIAKSLDTVPLQFLAAFELKLYNEEWLANMLQCQRERMIRMVLRMKSLEKYFLDGEEDCKTTLT